MAKSPKQPQPQHNQQYQHTRSTTTRKRSQRAALPALRLDLAIDEYERDLRRREISPKTIGNYRQILLLALRFWREQLGRPPTLDDLTVRAAEQFIDHLMDRGKLEHWQTGVPSGTPLSQETLRTYVRTLKVFSSWLVAPKQRYTPEDRLKLVAMPRKPHTYKQPLDERETQALVDACDTSTVLGSRDLALLLTLLDTMRASTSTKPSSRYGTVSSVPPKPVT